ncbi:hypothetical protein DYQ86_20745 [Acidobacteria bacterium AB60]|nr:hypothetical protein DYQ86_20745 [Acidobacteria bacterium AB60]
MEADWEIEIAPDAPVIDGGWDGYVDLRGIPGRIDELNEPARLPGLRATLLRLNAGGSPVWTAKCDVWALEAFDPDEMEASREEDRAAQACYLDLIPADPNVSLDGMAEWCRRLCLELRRRALRQSRVDAVIRRAVVGESDAGCLGVTAYVSACGPSAQSASKVLSAAVSVLADAVLATGPAVPQASKYNRDIVGE